MSEIADSAPEDLTVAGQGTGREESELYVDESADRLVSVSGNLDAALTTEHEVRSGFDAADAPLVVEPGSGTVAGDGVDQRESLADSAESPEPADSGESGESASSTASSTAEEIELDRPTGIDGLIDLADPLRLRAAIEAVLFVVEAPVTVAALATVARRPTAEVESALAELVEEYARAGRGIELRWIADGVRIYTRPELAPVVEAFLLEGQRTKLSQAGLETLAVIAYRQPVTRGRISAIRGVNVDGVVRTLVSRGMIIEDGTDVESGAGLFRTTALFLEKMGLQSLEELPSLAPLLPEIDSLDTDEL